MPEDLTLIDNLDLLKKYSKKLDAEYVIAKDFKSAAEVKALKEKTKLKICKIIIDNNQQQVNKFRQLVDYIAVLGGDVTKNKFAASNKRVDILLQPCIADRLSFDTAIANMMKQNKQILGILFSDFLNAGRFQRTILFKNYIFAAKICKKYKVEVKLFSGARNEFELRSPEDLLAMKNLLQVRK